MNQQNNPYYPFATHKEYKYTQCGITKKGMKTYNYNMLNEQITGVHFPGFTNGDGIQKLEASMPDDVAPMEWDLHTLEDMRWNDNHQHPINYWS
jgi:hypothetical protein